MPTYQVEVWGWVGAITLPKNFFALAGKGYRITKNFLP